MPETPAEGLQLTLEPDHAPYSVLLLVELWLLGSEVEETITPLDKPFLGPLPLAVEVLSLLKDHDAVQVCVRMALEGAGSLGLLGSGIQVKLAFRIALMIWAVQ